jgi:hypothetical protein
MSRDTVVLFEVSALSGQQNTTCRYALVDRPVTPSVVAMGYQRLPYYDAATTTEMASDCTVVGRELHLPEQEPSRPDSTERAPAMTTPTVSDELAEMAAGLELHFD